jgi:DNA-binding transcriptional LysR family regulator
MPTMERLRVAFDAMPTARWGPLFHLLCLEQPDARIEWQRAAFPARDRPVLDGADVGLRVEPPPEPGVSSLAICAEPMVLLMAAGLELAAADELCVEQVLDQRFPGAESRADSWVAFWTLDARRGGPPEMTGDDVRTTDEGLDVVAAGRAVATMGASMAGGLAHPGVVALPISDGPAVTTRLIWRTDAENPLVHALVDLARALTTTPDEARPRGTASGSAPTSPGGARSPQQAEQRPARSRRRRRGRR